MLTLLHAGHVGAVEAPGWRPGASTRTRRCRVHRSGLASFRPTCTAFPTVSRSRRGRPGSRLSRRWPSGRPGSRRRRPPAGHRRDPRRRYGLSWRSDRGPTALQRGSRAAAWRRRPVRRSSDPRRTDFFARGSVFVSSPRAVRAGHGGGDGLRNGGRIGSRCRCRGRQLRCLARANTVEDRRGPSGKPSGSTVAASGSPPSGSTSRSCSSVRSCVLELAGAGGPWLNFTHRSTSLLRERIIIDRSSP
jgi:hypothetical protein